MGTKLYGPIQVRPGPSPLHHVVALSTRRPSASFYGFTLEGNSASDETVKAIVKEGSFGSQTISWAPSPTAKIVFFCGCLKGSIPMDLEEEAIENPVKGENDDQEENAISEPYVGMEFDSEEAARKFYIDYARRVGFVVRIMQRRRSGIDGRTLARRLGCNKQGFSPNQKGSHGPDKKPRPSAREGCKATILVKMEKSGKWVVTRFVKDHNHPLVVTANGFSSMGDKEKKIEELTLELERQEQLCVAYREQLLSFMNNVDQQNEELSSKIQPVVENLRRIESETQKHSIYR